MLLSYFPTVVQIPTMPQPGYFSLLLLLSLCSCMTRLTLHPRCCCYCCAAPVPSTSPCIPVGYRLGRDFRGIHLGYKGSRTSRFVMVESTARKFYDANYATRESYWARSKYKKGRGQKALAALDLADAKARSAPKKKQGRKNPLDGYTSA